MRRPFAAKQDKIQHNSNISVISDIIKDCNTLSITTPLNEGLAFKEASFTSPALSPKIALRSFSSGVGSDSPFGVILPMIISV